MVNEKSEWLMIYVPTIHQSTVPEKSPRDLKMISSRTTKLAKAKFFEKTTNFKIFKKMANFEFFKNDHFCFSPTHFVFSANDQFRGFLFEKWTISIFFENDPIFGIPSTDMMWFALSGLYGQGRKFWTNNLCIPKCSSKNLSKSLFRFFIFWKSLSSEYDIWKCFFFCFLNLLLIWNNECYMLDYKGTRWQTANWLSRPIMLTSATKGSERRGVPRDNKMTRDFL